MAAKKQQAMDERIYTIPLRREFIKVPRVKKANRAVKAVKTYISKHMKAEHVIISQELNEKIWERGIHKPPAKIKVKAVMESEGVAKVGLPEEKSASEREKGKAKKMKERAARKAEQEEKVKQEAEKQAAEAEKESAEKKETAETKPQAEEKEQAKPQEKQPEKPREDSGQKKEKS